jgi:hypothetical protein
MEYFIAPKPCDLKWARGRFPVPIGTRDGGRGARSSKSWEGEAFAEPREIEVRWERDERKFTLWFALPSSARAEIVLPPIVPEGASVNTKLVKGEATSPKFEANHWRIKVSAGAQGKIEARW